jgi:hypothetical protein
MGFAILALVLPGQVTSPQQQIASAPLAELPHVADFRDQQASAEASQIAHWVMKTSDHQGKPFVVVDKQHVRVFVFKPDGTLAGATPALLGSAVGDDSVHGIGEREMSAILPHERTTPAGRFVSQPGINAMGEDIVWVDYEAAVSMHRVRAKEPRERRLERLASATPDDNRISFGCINLPESFYETVVKPALGASRGVVYILPETRPLQAVFKTYPASGES